MHVLVTGADGFVGRRVCKRLRERGHVVRGALFRPSAILGPEVEQVVVGDLSTAPDLTAALTRIDAVVHLAARVHVMDAPAGDSLAAFRRVNVDGTRHVAWHAARAGVRRLVFVSTIKVNGEETEADVRFVESDQPRPQDPYAISKWEAERALRQIEAKEGLEVTIIRPPLVYGPDVKGNLLRLLWLLSLRLPLPFGRIDNRRSLIGASNLADLLSECVVHRRAAGETFLASDPRDLSTPELLRILAKGLGYTLRMVAVPPSLLHTVGRALRKSDAFRRLCGSLVVDAQRCRRVLGWSPTHSTTEGLIAMARWYGASELK